MRTLLPLGLLGVLVGCGSATPPPQEPEPRGPPPADAPVATDAAPAAPAEPEEPELFATLPPGCDSDAPCVPPATFARAMCQGRFEALTLTMFEKSSPWQRLYLKAEYVEAVNAHDKHLTAEPIVFGEEVLVLRDGSEAGKDGALRVGSSDIDVLRWDGTCATVAREMFVTTMMPEVKAPPISWRHLGGNLRGALLKSKYVRMSHEREKEVCRGERASDPSPACEKARRMLQDSITVAVRGGISLPTPDELPVWATAEERDASQTVALSNQ